MDQQKEVICSQSSLSTGAKLGIMKPARKDSTSSQTHCLQSVSTSRAFSLFISSAPRVCLPSACLCTTPALSACLQDTLSYVWSHCSSSCHALQMMPSECQAYWKLSIVTHTFPHSWPRFPPQLALWPSSLLCPGSSHTKLLAVFLFPVRVDIQYYISCRCTAQ